MAQVEKWGLCQAQQKYAGKLRNHDRLLLTKKYIIITISINYYWEPE
jgi:hypothetical protein